MSKYLRGNHMILDGDILGITPDMSQSEVLQKIRHPMNLRGCIFYMHTIQIAIREKLYMLKDREFGRCDFKGENNV